MNSLHEMIRVYCNCVRREFPLFSPLSDKEIWEWTNGPETRP